MMRVLFLYYDFPTAEPLLRCRKLLSDHGISVDARPVMLAVEDREFGTSSAIISEHLSDTYDVLLLQHQLMREEALCCGRPVVLMERIDGAQLETRHWLPNVAGIIKSYAMRPRSMNNEHRGRATARRLKDAGVTATNTRVIEGVPPPLTDAELAKIHVGYGFGSYSRMAPLARQFVDLGAPRPFRVQFRGHLSYRSTEIESHRRLAAQAVQGLANMMPAEVACGNPLHYDHYTMEMFLSKSVVSPWGWGEDAYRDYEAWLLGAVLVKPDTDYVESWPDVYHSGKTYVKCAVDFSDLPGIVMEVADNWVKYREMRECARALALEATKTKAIAARLAAIFGAVA